MALEQQHLIQILFRIQSIVGSQIQGPMEFLIAGCFIFPLSALWIQSQEDDNNEEEIDFL